MQPFDLTLDPLVPPRWARSGHAQTIWGHLLPSPRVKEPGERIAIPVSGGDALVARLFAPRAGEPLVVAHHGLGGDAAVDYMRRLAIVCGRLGVGCLLVNHRGCGEGLGLARGAYHSGCSPDLAAVIGEARRLFPASPLVAVGFSLSGNALALLLGKFHDLPQPDAAIVVNAPIDLAAASALLRLGWNRLYDVRFLRRCVAGVRRQRRAFGKPPPDFPRLDSLYAFDAHYTAKAAGFSSAEEYYEKCSAGPWLSRVRVPTLLLTAEDDPFVPVGAYRSAKLSPSIRLHVERHGGHMGYLSARPTPSGSRRWLDYALEEAIRATTGR